MGMGPVLRDDCNSPRGTTPTSEASAGAFV